MILVPRLPTSLAKALWGLHPNELLPLFTAASSLSLTGVDPSKYLALLSVSASALRDTNVQ